MSLPLYDAALADRIPAGPLAVRYADDTTEHLDIDRWRGALDAADGALLARVDGPTLDVGCGPGRLVGALYAAGVPALGLDIAAEAIRLTRARGAAALHGSVWGAVPGGWSHALLADGNIGIGGDPERLLARVRALLRPGGSVHVECARPGAGSRPLRARLEHGGRVGEWFPWARLCVDDAAGLAERVGLVSTSRWSVGGRWFASLARP
jgi:SAM-dependent methyltransferase